MLFYLWTILFINNVISFINNVILNNFKLSPTKYAIRIYVRAAVKSTIQDLGWS